MRLIETTLICKIKLLSIFALCRLKKGKQLEKEEAINEVKKNIHLIKAPHAGKTLSFIFVSPTLFREFTIIVSLQNAPVSKPHILKIR